MKENGVLDQIFAKYAPEKQDCPSPGLSMGFESCVTAFFPIIGGFAISIFLLMIEFHPTSWKRLAKILKCYDRKDKSPSYKCCPKCRQRIF